MFVNAEAYERFMGRWSRLVAVELRDFAAPPERGCFLDLGCGTGALTFSIAERYPLARVVGVELSSEYVAYANARNPFGDRVSFEMGDAQRLPFADSSFDGAASLLAFNFIPEPGKALAEICRVVRRGGAVSAAVWDYDAGMRMLRVFWDAASASDRAAEKLDERRMPLCRAGELSALWREAGLESVREGRIDIQMRFTSFADFWEPFLSGQGPAGAYASGCTPSLLSSLCEEVKRRLGRPAEDRPIDLPARAWAVCGICGAR